MTAQSIFIIEDEVITAQSLAKNIRDLGYRVSGIATSGSKALMQIEKLRPDLILMDIRLKNNDIDGIATAETIKKQLQLNIPVIYLTAHSDVETLDRAKITEPFGYILKPYNKKDLEIHLKMALHKHHQELKLIQNIELATSQTTELQPISVTEANLERLRSYLIDLVLHELRIPLTVILSTSESLKRYRQRWTEEKQNQSFERIQKAVQKMTELLDNVAVWEQAQIGKLSFEPSLTDAIALCEELLTEISLIDENNHELVFTHQGKAENIYLDQTLLKYILNNLLLNAIKYSPGKSRVDLILKYQENSLVIQVEDRGIGIPQGDLDHIFESFYRAKNIDKISGTGLGLAIVKLCLSIHQGTITVASELDIGTTFTVTLPRN